MKCCEYGLYHPILFVRLCFQMKSWLPIAKQHDPCPDNGRIRTLNPRIMSQVFFQEGTTSFPCVLFTLKVKVKSYSCVIFHDQILYLSFKSCNCYFSSFKKDILQLAVTRPQQFLMTYLH